MPDFEVSKREALVLAALDGKELYGLEIPEAIEEMSEGKQKMSLGGLYPALRSLEGKNLIVGRWGEEVDPIRRGARRRYYKLTGSGSTKLRSLQSDDGETTGDWLPA